MPDGTETEIEIETEQPGAPVSGDAAETGDAADQTAAPEVEIETATEAAPSTPDQSAALEALAAQVWTLTGERDAAIGQAVAGQAVVEAAQAEVQALRGETAILRERLLSYELGAALTTAGLPPGATGLVRALYAAALRDGCHTDVGVWLSMSMADPNHPAAALALMRMGGAVPDPRNTAAPMNGAASSSLKPFPITY